MHFCRTPGGNYLRWRPLPDSGDSSRKPRFALFPSRIWMGLISEIYNSGFWHFCSDMIYKCCFNCFVIFCRFTKIIKTKMRFRLIQWRRNSFYKNDIKASLGRVTARHTAWRQSSVFAENVVKTRGQQRGVARHNVLRAQTCTHSHLALVWRQTYLHTLLHIDEWI